MNHGHLTGAADDESAASARRRVEGVWRIESTRIVAAMMPDEPDAHALLALLELQASRFAARIDAAGKPVLLANQDRSRWDHLQIRRGRAALARADAICRGRGAYALQARIAACHAIRVLDR